MSTGDPTAASTAPEPIRFGSPTGRWVLLASILGSGMAGIDATVVNVALPAIGRDLETDFCRSAVDGHGVHAHPRVVHPARRCAR